MDAMQQSPQGGGESLVNRGIRLHSLLSQLCPKTVWLKEKQPKNSGLSSNHGSTAKLEEFNLSGDSGLLSNQYFNSIHGILLVKIP